jgi:hypothetical protein
MGLPYPFPEDDPHTFKFLIRMPLKPMDLGERTVADAGSDEYEIEFALIIDEPQGPGPRGSLFPERAS